jgi:hypothetical protein
VYSAQRIPIPILWLPEDRRGGVFSSHGTTVVLGGRLGSVTILDLSALVQFLL